MRTDLTMNGTTFKNKSESPQPPSELRQLPKVNNRYRQQLDHQLEQRESICKLMKVLQRQERGAFQFEIKREQSKSEFVKLPKMNREHCNQQQNLSLIQSRKISKLILPQEGGKSAGDSLAKMEIQKTLMIKNMVLNSPSRDLQAKSKQRQSSRIREKLFGLKANSKGEASKHLNLKEPSTEMQKHRYLRPKESHRMKTQGDGSLSLEKRERFNKNNQMLFNYEKSKQNCLDNINIEIKSNMWINQLQPYFMRKKASKDRSSNIIQKSLSKNKENFLRIKKLEPKIEINKLYFTENPKVETPLDSIHSFRQYEHSVEQPTLK